MKRRDPRHEKKSSSSRTVEASPTTVSNATSRFVATLHRTAGNQAAQRLFGHLRPQVNVSHPAEAREREAERVAAAFSRGSAARLAGDGALAGTDRAGRAHSRPGNASALSLGTGRPLPPTVRSVFESRFGDDFGAVRVHTGSRGDEAARAINATAFTTGEDIGFRAGAYEPQTSRGRTLLAHELAHVVQQRSHADDVVFRQVESYADVEDRLTYGVFDWAVTDEDAREVLEYLRGLSDTDLLGVIHRLQRDGLLSRLLGNVSDADEVAYDAVLERIREQRTREAQFTEESKKALELINDRLELADALSGLLTAAPFLTVSSLDPTDAYLFFTTDWDAYVRAIQSVPVIVKSRVQQDIQFQLIRSDLPPSERRFWQKMYELWSR